MDLKQNSASEGPEAADRRMADVAAFADGLVHDLRNPLNVIRTNVYLLRQRLVTDDAKAARAVERIDDQVTGAMRLLDDAQAFYRADRPTMAPVALSELVRAALGNVPLPDGYALQTELEELPPIAGDASLLETALRALVRNAMDAMTGGGLIRVTVQPAERWAKLAVEDEGPGVAETDLPHVWEPFYTTRRAHAGLGLTLVEKIARAHGGRAFLESRPGAGTLAGLLLPVSQG